MPHNNLRNKTAEKGGAPPCLLFLLWLNASKGPQCVWPAATAVCSLFWWHRNSRPSSASTNPTIYGKTNVRSLNIKKQQAAKFFWKNPKKQQTKNNFSIQEAHTNQPTNNSKIEQNAFRWPCKNNATKSLLYTFNPPCLLFSMFNFKAVHIAKYIIP